MDGGDPLAAIIRPPSSESDEERQLRLQREAEAKKISDRIDEEISQDEKRFKKQKQDIKVCLSKYRSSRAIYLTVPSSH